MSASDYQRAVEILLRRCFSDVRLEWSVLTDAADAFERNVRRYAPRVDIAVGPFSTSPGRDDRISAGLIPVTLRALFDGREPNPNPRCLLAIEVIYSSSSKHILGDLLNAGALGLYGLAIGSDELIPKIRRIGQYLELLAELEKLPWLFRNVVSLSSADFDAALRTASPTVPDSG